MIKIVTTEEMIAIETAADTAGTSLTQLMQNAGGALADLTIEQLGTDHTAKQVLILVGPGNNGGDGLVAARILPEYGVPTTCYLYRPRSDDDPVFTATQESNTEIILMENDKRWTKLKKRVTDADLIIDALLGTGAKPPLRPDMKKLIAMVNKTLGKITQVADQSWELSPNQRLAPPAPIIIAVDCPSGLDCDTGEIDSAALQADITLTFAAAKHGHLRFPGAGFTRQLRVADIGISKKLPELAAIPHELITANDIRQMLPQRPLDGHKGTFGKAAIIAGSINYTGAAALAGEAAYRAGAGLVSMAVPHAIYPILAAGLPEAIWLLLPHDMGAITEAGASIFHREAGGSDSLLIGPGLGQDSRTKDFLYQLLSGEESSARKGMIGFGNHPTEDIDQEAPHPLPDRLVIDADGLNLLAQIESWWDLLPPNTILTPHPGEMSHLTGLSTQDIQADRLAIAAEKATEWDCIVVLKGAYTIVAFPDTNTALLPFASDALATAGTGDILAGLICGLLAQGIPPKDAAIIGTYIHGLAGKLTAEYLPTRTILARDILNFLPQAFSQIENKKRID